MPPIERCCVRQAQRPCCRCEASEGCGMHDGESRTRAALITFFPMFIATLSLVTSIYNGYLNSKFVDIIQRNVGRAEYMKTCKDIIDAYFQVKFRVGSVPASSEASSI